MYYVIQFDFAWALAIFEWFVCYLLRTHRHTHTAIFICCWPFFYLFYAFLFEFYLRGESSAIHMCKLWSRVKKITQIEYSLTPNSIPKSEVLSILFLLILFNMFASSLSKIHFLALSPFRPWPSSRATYVQILEFQSELYYLF